MAHKITPACMGCGACAGICPRRAISTKDGRFVINADLCKDCDMCVSACPLGAIIKE